MAFGHWDAPPAGGAPLTSTLGVMRFAVCREVILLISFFTVGNVSARDLSGQWDLAIEDKNHNVVSVLVIKFGSSKAQSCLGGDWLRVDVVSSSTKDKTFFPVTDALSYSIENNQLTIGRNEVCDAYLMLQGKLNEEIIRGGYFSFGWKSTPLGFFVLSKRGAEK